MKKYMKPTLEIEFMVQDTNISSGGSTCDICVGGIKLAGELCAPSYGKTTTEYFQLPTEHPQYDPLKAYACKRYGTDDFGENCGLPE